MVKRKLQIINRNRGVVYGKEISGIYKLYI